MAARVNRCLQNTLDAAFPSHCLLCDLPVTGSLPLCPGCRLSLVPNNNACRRCALPLCLPASDGATALCGQCLQRPPPFTRTLAPWLYEEGLARLIRQWKFHGRQLLTPLLAQLWLQQESAAAVDLLVPVPLHWRRLWSRGFNQATLLAMELQRQSPVLQGAELVLRGVCRHRATSAQHRLGARRRRSNLQHAFTVSRPCANLRAAIVDDVMTTGATATALSQALLQAGAADVQLWCLARTP